MKSISVEGFSVTLAASATATAGPSTGKAKAERYIDTAVGRRPAFIA